MVVAGEDRQYTLTRLPGFLHLVETPPRTRPPHLSATELAGMSAADRLALQRFPRGMARQPRPDPHTAAAGPARASGRDRGGQPAGRGQEQARRPGRRLSRVGQDHRGAGLRQGLPPAADRPARRHHARRAPAGAGHLHRADRQHPHQGPQPGNLPLLRAAHHRQRRHPRRPRGGRGPGPGHARSSSSTTSTSSTCAAATPRRWPTT